MEQIIWTGEAYDVATVDNSVGPVSWPAIKDGVIYASSFKDQRVAHINGRIYFGFMADVVPIENIMINETGTALSFDDKACYFLTSTGAVYKN